MMMTSSSTTSRPIDSNGDDDKVEPSPSVRRLPSSPSSSSSSLSIESPPRRAHQLANLRYFQQVQRRRRRQQGRDHDGTTTTARGVRGHRHRDIVVVRSPFVDSSDDDDDSLSSPSGSSHSSNDVVLEEGDDQQDRSRTNGGRTQRRSEGTHLDFVGPVRARRRSRHRGRAHGRRVRRPTTPHNPSMSSEWSRSLSSAAAASLSSILHRHHQDQRGDDDKTDDVDNTRSCREEECRDDDDIADERDSFSRELSACSSVTFEGSSSVGSEDRKLAAKKKSKPERLPSIGTFDSRADSPTVNRVDSSSSQQYPHPPPPSGLGSTRCCCYLVLSSHPHDRVVVELFTDQVPCAVDAFEASMGLVRGRRGGKETSAWQITKIVPHSYVQLGRSDDGAGDTEVTVHDAAKAGSIPEEPMFQHSEAGLLSVPINGSSDVIITVRPMHQFDGMRTVIGRVLEGLDTVLQDLTQNTAVDNKRRPMFEVIRIIDAGRVVNAEKAAVREVPSNADGEKRSVDVPSGDALDNSVVGRPSTSSSLAPYKASANDYLDFLRIAATTRLRSTSIMLNSLSTASDESGSTCTGPLEALDEAGTISSAAVTLPPSRATTASDPVESTGSLVALDEASSTSRSATSAVLPSRSMAITGSADLLVSQSVTALPSIDSDCIDLTDSESISFSVFLRSPSTVESFAREAERVNSLNVKHKDPNGSKAAAWNENDSRREQSGALSTAHEATTELSTRFGTGSGTKLEPPGRVLNRMKSEASDGSRDADDVDPCVSALSLATSSDDAVVTKFGSPSESPSPEASAMRIIDERVSAIVGRLPKDFMDGDTAPAWTTPVTLREALDAVQDVDVALGAEPPNLGSMSFSPVQSFRAFDASDGAPILQSHVTESMDVTGFLSASFDQRCDHEHRSPAASSGGVFGPTSSSLHEAGSLSSSMWLWFGEGFLCSPSLDDKDPYPPRTRPTDAHSTAASTTATTKSTTSRPFSEELRSVLRQPKYTRPVTKYLRVGTSSTTAASTTVPIMDGDNYYPHHHQHHHVRPPRVPRGESRRRNNKAVSAIPRNLSSPTTTFTSNV